MAVVNYCVLLYRYCMSAAQVNDLPYKYTKESVAEMCYFYPLFEQHHKHKQLRVFLWNSKLIPKKIIP